MDERELYATILGLTGPWKVERVELRESERAVHVWVREVESARFECPDCGAAAPIHDQVERSWRHLDTCQFQTQVHAAIARVQCATHGVKTITVPWAARHSRFTLLFERLAIAWLKEATPLAVAQRKSPAPTIVASSQPAVLVRRHTIASEARTCQLALTAVRQTLQFLSVLANEAACCAHVALGSPSRLRNHTNRIA